MRKNRSRNKSRRRKRVKSYLRKSSRRSSRRRNPSRKFRTKKRSFSRKSRKRSFRKRRKNPFFAKRRFKSKKRRANPRRRFRKVRKMSRRRRNPQFARTFKGAFQRKRLMRGAGIVFGLGAGAFAKQLVLNVIPPTMPWAARVYGLLAILGGAMINMNSRKLATKSFGTGVLSYGILDLLISNVKPLAQFLPQIAGPSFSFAPSAGTGPAEMTNGGMTYGRSMMGANLQAGVSPEIVGAELRSHGPVDIVGHDSSDDEYGIDNMLE